MSETIEELEKRYEKYSEQASRGESNWSEAAERAKDELIAAKQEQIEELSDPREARKVRGEIEELRQTPKGEVADL
jgi:predicted  nucleic acid-binding Zn-ribbon protein